MEPAEGLRDASSWAGADPAAGAPDPHAHLVAVAGAFTPAGVYWLRGWPYSAQMGA